MNTLIKNLAEQVTRLTLENIELRSVIEDLKRQIATNEQENGNNE